MPIYEYHCDDCGTDFEKFLRSMFSKEAINCPGCGGDHVEKAVSMFASSNSSVGGGGVAPACGPVG
ncbi:MAG: zinc ribbon domain-containing protein [Chloroflexota bacterium]|nr:zinc ribbon domain-containing protein [Chloroflexota bacterium]